MLTNIVPHEDKDSDPPKDAVEKRKLVLETFQNLEPQTVVLISPSSLIQFFVTSY